MEVVTSVTSCIPIIPSADLDKSLRLWVDGLAFAISSEMRKDGKVVCMLSKDELCFMLNQRAGNALKPGDYEGIRLYWRPTIYTKPGSDYRALARLSQNSKSGSMGKPNLSLPRMAAIRMLGVPTRVST
jgi:hypothetical protein